MILRAQFPDEKNRWGLVFPFSICWIMQKRGSGLSPGPNGNMFFSRLTKPFKLEN
jgi:hypothetical protein